MFQGHMHQIYKTCMLRLATKKKQLETKVDEVEYGNGNDQEKNCTYGEDLGKHTIQSISI